VPQVVRADGGQSGLFQDRLEVAPVDVARVQVAARLIGEEQPLVVVEQRPELLLPLLLPLQVLPESIDDRLREQQRAVGLGGLGDRLRFHLAVDADGG